MQKTFNERFGGDKGEIRRLSNRAGQELSRFWDGGGLPHAAGPGQNSRKPRWGQQDWAREPPPAQHPWGNLGCFWGGNHLRGRSASPVPLHSVGGGCPLPASFPVLVGAKREPTTPLLVKLAVRPPCGLGATSSHTERRCRVLESAIWGTWGSSHAGGRSRSTATPSSPSLCPSGTHWRSAGCRGAEANLSPATAAAPCPQAPPSPPTSPALSNAAPATSSAPGRPVAPLATPPTSWCCGESGATSPWQPRAAHWDTGIFGDVPCVPPLPRARRGRAFFPPAMPHHGRARGTRRVPPRPTPCRGTASTSSPTPRPGWRRGGDPTCTAAPTSP